MKDKLSALMDGALDEQAMRHVLDSIRRDRSLRDDWETYCVIGDALRGDREGSPRMVARVMAGIESEPTMLAPRVPAKTAGGSRLSRSVMPLAASLMGVAAVGLVAHTLYPRTEGVGRVANASTALRVADRTPIPARPAAASSQIDPHREYVFAHQAMTGGGPLSGAIQHIRTVADARQDAGR